MATTNHVVVANFAPSSSSTCFNQLWKLSRALKKAGWKYIASGNGSAKDPSSGAPTYDPEPDTWAGTNTATNSGTTAAIATPSRGRATVTGLTGIVAADKGRFLHITSGSVPANQHYHQIEEVLSSTSVRIDARTFAVANEAGPLTWEIRDPLAEAYPSATLAAAAAWILLRGPSILKIPITAAPAPGAGGLTFVRGENIVQATTGMECEILGFVYYGGAGYLVVTPRLRGTGAGIYGLTTGNVFTGAVSGATVTQNGTALEYRRELVIAKTTNETSGMMWAGCFEPVGDASDMFSAKVSTATATTPPGGSANFPNFAYVMHGGSSFAAFHWSGHQSGYYPTMANAQIICADAIEEEDHSADGSWTWAQANAETPGGGHQGFAFQRVDDCEDGDLDPYVAFNGCAYNVSSPVYSNARTTGIPTGAQAVSYDQFTCGASRSGSTYYTCWKGWRGRGMAGDSSSNFQEFEEALLRPMQTGTAFAITYNYTTGERFATALTPTKVREPIWIVATQANRKMRKGTLRWWGMVAGGNGTDTHDNKQWIQLSPTNSPYIVGPWDGVTAPYAT